MHPKTAKCKKMAHPKKRQKTDRHHGRKKTKMVSKLDECFVAETVPKSSKFINAQKWTPGASWNPKGIQKAPKRHQQGIKKASKLIQIRSHRNQQIKLPMQRTAKNHVPYQSFPTERNHKFGTAAGCAAHWIVYIVYY